MKRSYLSSPYQKSRSYSPAVITQGGRVIWLAGHIASEDEDGNSLGGGFRRSGSMCVSQAQCDAEASRRRTL